MTLSFHAGDGRLKRLWIRFKEWRRCRREPCSKGGGHSWEIGWGGEYCLKCNKIWE